MYLRVFESVVGIFSRYPSFVSITEFPDWQRSYLVDQIGSIQISLIRGVFTLGVFSKSFIELL